LAVAALDARPVPAGHHDGRQLLNIVGRILGANGLNPYTQAHRYRRNQKVSNAHFPPPHSLRLF
jgi:hypothetical protein